MRYSGATRFGVEIGNFPPHISPRFCCFTHIVSSILIADLFSYFLVTQKVTQSST